MLFRSLKKDRPREYAQLLKSREIRKYLVKPMHPMVVRGFKIFGGFEFTPNLAVEMAYVDLGELAYSGSFSGTPVTNGRLETTGFNFALVGTFPVSSSFSLFAKGGIFGWLAEARDITGGSPFVGRDEGGDVSFGLGAAFHLDRNLSLRAEWEYFEANDSITLLSAGLAYRF